MSEAIISACGTYRYTLHRKTRCVLRWNHPALFIMLNPSTADAELDDPTIRRCISFAESFQCNSLTVVNLFALRSTDPKLLGTHPDPVGPENDKHIEEQVIKHRSGLIIAAWGANGFAAKRAKEVKLKFGPFDCLGTTKDGSPRHPLYLSKDTQWKNLT